MIAVFVAPQPTFDLIAVFKFVVSVQDEPSHNSTSAVLEGLTGISPPAYIEEVNVPPPP